MKPFEYFAPTSLPEASEILTRYDGAARLVAGGTDLMLKMKAGRLAPKAIVNIKRIPDLRGLELNSHLSIGALTTLEELRRSTIVRQCFPAVSDAAATMASIQIRHLATIGGNMCNAAPSADLAPVLIAYDATTRIAGPNGERRVRLEEFFSGPGATVLKPDELLVAIEVPRSNCAALYLKHSPRACMDIAVVGVGLALRMNEDRCESARIALGAVAPTPIRALRAETELIDQPLTADRIGRAARIASDEARPIDDVRGAAWYRRQMIEVLTRRGLNTIADFGMRNSE